ncbi:MAG: hypothetical protein ACKVTZ_05235, partial [Bacteroidia bacterium]
RKAIEEKELLAAQAAKDRSEKEKAQKQLRTVQLLLAFAVVALLLAIGGVVFALLKKNEADEATKVAQAKTKEAEQKTFEALHSDSLAKVEKANAEAKTRVALRADSLTKIEKANAEAKTKEAIKEKENAKKSLQDNIAAEEATKKAELKPLIEGIKTAIEAEEMESAKAKYKAAIEKHADSKELRELGQKYKLE